MLCCCQITSKNNNRREDAQLLQSQALDALYKLMHAETSDLYEERKLELEKNWSDFPEFMKYLKNEWFLKKEKWCQAWRQVCIHILVLCSGFERN